MAADRGRRAERSSALLLLYFHRWYLFIVAVNVALIVGIAWMDWPSKSAVGA